MAKILKWSGIVAGAVAVVALAAVAYVYVASESEIAKSYPLPPSRLHASSDADSIARGKHFAAAYGCMDCHRKNLQGTFIPDFRMTSRNLTRLAKTFTDADFDHAVRMGLRPDGTSVAEQMPSDAFQFMAAADLADIVAYLRSLPPQGNDVPIPSFGLMQRAAFLKGIMHTDQFWFGMQKAALDMGPHYARGRSLAMAACGECHMTALTGPPPDPGQLGPRPPDLSLVASYDRADFLRFMRTGKAAGNRELRMMSAAARVRFSHFTDSELGAIYDYLSARGKQLAEQAAARPVPAGK